MRAAKYTSGGEKGRRAGGHRDKVTAAGVPDFTGLGLLTADSAGVVGIIGNVSAQGAAHGLGTANKP